MKIRRHVKKLIRECCDVTTALCVVGITMVISVPIVYGIVCLLFMAVEAMYGI